MKKGILFISIFLSVLLTMSCNHLLSKQKLLLGTWKPAPNQIGEDVDITLTFKTDTIIMSLDISENGEKIRGQSIYLYTIDDTHIYTTLKTVIINGNELETIPKKFKRKQTFKYKLNGDTLSLSLDGKTILYIKQ